MRLATTFKMQILSLIVPVVMFIVLWVVWSFIERRLKWLVTFNKLPGPTLVQLIQLCWKLLTSKDLMVSFKVIQETITPFTRSSAPLFRIWLGPYPCAVLHKPEAVKTLLNSHEQIEKAKLYKVLRNWLGDGLITSKGLKWQQRRKLLTPAFHFKILDDFRLVMDDQAAILVQILQQKCEEAKCGEFDIYPFINRCTMDILCETAMGQGVNAQMNHDSEYVNAIDRLEEMIAERVVNPLLHFDWIHRLSPLGRLERRLIDITHGHNDNFIKMKRQKLVESKKNGLTKVNGNDHVLGLKRRVALLDLLLEMSMEDEVNHGQPMTDQDILEEVGTFMQVGHSTTTIAISCLLYYLGLHRHIQQKIVDEINEVYSDSEESSSIDLHKLKYMECVIKETLRLCPTTPVFGRRITEDINICGHTIPAGVTAVIYMQLIQRDPANYPQPHVFDPDRFLPENSQDRDPFAHIPFSAGPRNCIGQRYAMMEMKVVVAAVLRRFKLTVLEPHVMTKLIEIGLSKPLHGMPIRLEPRSN